MEYFVLIPARQTPTVGLLCRIASKEQLLSQPAEVELEYKTNIKFDLYSNSSYESLIDFFILFVMMTIHR